MGTITERPRKGGTTGYFTQILIKRKGRIVHREAQTSEAGGQGVAGAP